MNNKWFVLKRNATIHHLALISGSIVVDLPKIIGVGFKKHICVFRKGEIMHWYYKRAGIDLVARFMIKKLLQIKILIIN